MKLSRGASFTLERHAGESSGAVRFQITSQLMENYETGKIYSANGQMEAHVIPTRDDFAGGGAQRAVLFTLADGTFRAMTAEPAKQNRWKAEQLRAGVERFAVQQRTTAFLLASSAAGAVTLGTYSPGTLPVWKDVPRPGLTNIDLLRFVASGEERTWLLAASESTTKRAAF